MSKPKVKIVDRHFAHAASIGNGPLTPDDLPFAWDRSDRPAAFTVFTDNDIRTALASPVDRPVALLLESPAVTPDDYRRVRKNWQRFHRILTFDRRILRTARNARFYPLGGTWIPFDEWDFYPKEANVSLLASAKKQLPGHQLRHSCIERYRNRIDWVCGDGVEAQSRDKRQALRPFRYSVIIENVRHDTYFSEKLIDCFACGTVPIYWGCPSIGRFFRRDGMITFRWPWQLKHILSRIGPEDYARRLPALRENFSRARNFRSPEKHIWGALRDLMDPESAFSSP